MSDSIRVMTVDDHQLLRRGIRFSLLSVDDIEVVESPDELLSKAAVEAVRQWTFEPALCDGRPVGVYYDLTIKFHLK